MTGLPRATLTNQRATAEEQHYKLIKAVKEHNLRKEPIGFKKLCQMEDHHIVNRFIKDSEAWGMVEGYLSTNECEPGHRFLTVTPVGDAFIEYYEQNPPIKKRVIYVPHSKLSQTEENRQPLDKEQLKPS